MTTQDFLVNIMNYYWVTIDFNNETYCYIRVVDKYSNRETRYFAGKNLFNAIKGMHKQLKENGDI